MRMRGLIYACLATLAFFVSTTDARADLIGLNVGVSISFLEGGPHVSAVNLPYSQTVTVGSGAEISGLSVSDVYLSTNPAGYEQTMTGTVTVDIGVDTITASFNGQGVPYGLYFTLTGLPTISGVNVTSKTGDIPGVTYFNSPTFTGNSVTLFFGFLGYQPGLAMSQTVSITEGASVPDPASTLLLFSTGLVGIAAGRRRWGR